MVKLEKALSLLQKILQFQKDTNLQMISGVLL